MSLAKSLAVFMAALMNPFRSNLAAARAVPRKRYGVPTPFHLRTAIMVIGIPLSLVGNSAAQETASSPDSNIIASGQDGAQCEQCDKVSPSISILDPNPIMGFENPALWGVRIKGVTLDPNVKSTSVRTQGNAALAVINPPSGITLTSSPISSRTSALAGIGNSGAILQLDFRVQTETIGLSADDQSPETTDDSFIDAYVSVKSLGLNNIPLGQAQFQKLRSGMYNTIGFSIPDSLSSALKDAAFNDLVFEFAIRAPHNIEGMYMFDNLRVHSVELVQSPTGSAPPAGYGGSLDLVVFGAKPASQTFPLGPAQIPGGFHLKQGTAGETTVQLKLGLDSSPALTCTYIADSDDKLDQTFILSSCTGGYHAGDLVSSNWASLGIMGGSAPQQLHAQLSLSPLGDLSGSGLLPPMPTYWGDADNCAPAPAHGKVVTVSTSCATQTAKANQIVTDYFNQLNSAKPSPNWVVTPVPEAALRSGDGTPATSSVRPEVAANDLPFSTGGDLNPGGSFDAYWKLSGNLTPTAVAGTDENLTHFDAAFTAHGVLFGDDIDAVDAKITADTDSGETTPAFKPATSTGTLGFYVFGEEIPSGGLTFSPSTGFSVDPSLNQEFDLPPIQIWIFDITLGALVDADLNAKGSAALSGADLSVIPTASIGGHISGGINLGIAEGNVDAKINLVALSAPTTAQVKWVLNTSPAICAATLNGSLDGNLNLSSGGGQVNLDASFGVCPFCYTDSYTLFKWNSLVSKSWALFDDTIDTQLFALPASMCKYPIKVSIVSPTSGSSLSSGLPTTLTGSATPTDSTLPYTSTYTWKYTRGANAGTITIDPAGANSANPTVTFGPPTSGNNSTWTIGLTATTTVRSASGLSLQQTATATPVTVTVTKIPKGVYIAQVSTSNNGVAIPDPVTGVLNVGNVPGIITVSGIVSGSMGTLNTAFTVAPCNDDTAACTSPGSATTLATSGAATASPSAAWTGFEGGFYKITMTTTAGASSFGTASAVIFGTVLF